MKNFDYKSVSIIFLSIFSIVLLSSCNLEKEEDSVEMIKEVNETQIENSMSDNEEMMDTEKMTEEDMDSEWSEEEEFMMEEKEMMEEESMMNDENKQEVMQDEEIMIKQWVYTDYSKDIVMKSEGDIVLFFHADWCPACVSIDWKIKSSEIPSDLTILKVDYDSEVELKEKYQVLTQTTFVQIDSEWNMIKKWFSARDLDDIVSRLD